MPVLSKFPEVLVERSPGAAIPSRITYIEPNGQRLDITGMRIAEVGYVTSPKDVPYVTIKIMARLVDVEG